MSDIRIDDLIDRQRLRRKLGFWRILALIVAVLAVVVITVLSLDPSTIGQTSRDHIARVKIEGAIVESDELLERLSTIKDNERVKGVILTVDSPGGTTAGGEAIYEALREIADEKPIVAQVGTLAASAGYMVSVAADHVVARQSSIVGSIGVIFQYPNIEGLLDAWGIDMRAIKSSPLKAEPNFFGDTPPGAEAMIENMILDSFDWFKALVAERRDFNAAQIARVADGSVFTGRQALDLGMIDALGGLDEAKAWLNENGVDEDLEIVVYAARDTRSRGLLLEMAALFLGGDAAKFDATTRFHDRVFLDGLLSVWHVDANCSDFIIVLQADQLASTC
ncbi:MAG: signal peptide peptidase SppA, partial [Pseudomonadota bacterium]